MIFALAGIPEHADASTDIALMQRYHQILAQKKAEQASRIASGFGCPGIIPPETAAAWQLKEELGLRGLGSEPSPYLPPVSNPFADWRVLALGGLAIAALWWWKKESHVLRTPRPW